MKLQLYILRQLIVSVAFSVGGLLLVALPGIAVRTVHEIPSARAVHVAQFVAISLQNVVPYVLPICFLLATVATYGRLAYDREWTAIQMAGVRPVKLLLPAVLVGGVLGAFALLLLTQVLPGGKARQRLLLVEATSEALTNLGPGGASLSFGDGAIVLEAVRFDKTTGLMHQVFLRRTNDAATREDYHADSARIEIVDGELLAELYELMYVARRDGELTQMWSEEVQVRQRLETEQASTSPRYLTNAQIRAHVPTVEDKTAVPRYWFELHYRYALAAVFLVFAFLGPATGLIARKGTQLGALSISLGYALVHYILQMQVAKGLGTSGAWDPVLAAWAPVAVGAVASFWITRRALRR
ncbi:MAG: LptF/LptG family permease [Planctomycetota bacterium]|nr:LptF/LptG family permease [Planctomycetota bacterium]